MIYRQTIKLSSAVFLFGCLCSVTISAQTTQTYPDTRKLLSEMRDVKNDSEKLAKLFRVGDKRIGDLVKALADPDAAIALRAQVVIRYLGNDVGVKGLLEWYEKQKQFQVAGPVPLPLREWDYKVIYEQFINEQTEKWIRSEPYIYALALDDSPKAKEALKKIVKIADDLDESTLARRAAKRIREEDPKAILTGDKDLIAVVLKNAFFVPPGDRKYTSARILAFNGLKDRALIELRVNRGRLSEEWYHVVVQKRGRGWQFFSITQVAVS